MQSGTSSTAAAFMVSQNIPSLVDASPMVPKATSPPPCENVLVLKPFFFIHLPRAR